jgi:hypothetical protein
MVDLKTLQTMHPTWNITSAMEAPNGGMWAVGADGGVFALDAQGTTAGLTAPYYGSYTELAANQRQGNRTFNVIEDNGHGGYQIRSTNMEIYGQNGEWSPKAAPLTQVNPGQTTVGTQQATDATPTSAGPNLSGTAALHAVLDPLGLGSLIDGPTGALAALAQPGADVNYISQVWLPLQKAYTDAFPEIAAAQTKATAAGPGAAPHIPTPAEIVTYRQTAQQMVDQGLLPPEFVTKDKVSALINGGVSVAEFQNRVLNGVDQFMNADPADQAAFLAYHPAVDFSHAVGALLDPSLNEAAVSRAIEQAKIGGAAIRSGFGPIAAGQATALQQAGQGSQAQFTQAALQNPLTQNLAGESDSLTKGTQLAAIGGNAAAQQAITDRLGRRQAAFQGGGGSAGGSQGQQGLGGAGQ